MRINPFIQAVLPVTEAYADIELWNKTVLECFSPFVRRRRILVDLREIFRAELVNLVRIQDQSHLSKALLDAVRMCRKAIYADPSASYAHMIAVFPEASEADSRWLGLCASANPLGADANLADRVADYMGHIDAVAEACLKPRVRFLFGFARHIATGSFPVGARDFGKYIDEWPGGQAPYLKLLFSDPIFGLAVSQWRNIAAHRNYRRVGPSHFEATYGRNSPRSVRFTFEELEQVLIWVRDLLYVCRMAEVIIYLEFSPELRQHGLQEAPIRFDAHMITLAHSLRMVGFTYVGEKTKDDGLAVLFTDDQSRTPRNAIIHLSQCLDSLAMAASSDLSLKDEVKKVGVGLVNSERKTYAWALVEVDAAFQRLNRQISSKAYISQIEWGFLGQSMGQV